MSDNPHKDHRKRLKRELMDQDFPESVPEHKMLEMLLFYGIPRKDTNPIAHELIKQFGSLSGVFEADADDLFQVNGMTENAVSLIKLILPIVRKMQADKYKKGYKFNSIDEFGEYIIKKYYGYNKEIFMISSFDITGKLIECDTVAKGDIDNVALSVKSIVKTVLKRNPTTVIISHNHIGSPAVPSIADLEMTKSLKYTLEQINVKLIDHIIVADNDYVSLKQSPNYNHIF